MYFISLRTAPETLVKWILTDDRYGDKIREKYAEPLPVTVLFFDGMEEKDLDTWVRKVILSDIIKRYMEIVSI